MVCPEILTTQAYIDGALTDAAADAAERDITGCAHCEAGSTGIPGRHHLPGSKT